MYTDSNNQKQNSGKKVLFVFDRVAHYHRELFRCLEKELGANGLKLYLLSGDDQSTVSGRVGLREPVIQNELKYLFREYRAASYTFRRHNGVLEMVEKIRPDIVVVLGHVGNISHWRLMTLKKKLGFKLVAWQCGYEYNASKIKDLVLKRFVPGFDHHLAYHTNAADYAMAYGAQKDNITVIYNTINEERIVSVSKQDARKTLCARHSAIGNRKIVLFVGAILAEKRIEVLLEAMAGLANANAVLVIVGDGPHMPEIRRQCEGREDVVLTGAVIEGVGPYFDAAEVYVLPGTGGLGINEAMAHGLPIISGYADGSADDLVLSGINGFRLQNGSSEEIREKVSLLLDNPDLAERMGRQSKKMITGKFAFKEFIGRIVDVISALSQRGVHD